MNAAPDDYVVTQGRILKAAAVEVVRTGDHAPLERILDHLVADMPGPGERTRDFLLAPVLFALSVEAKQQGKPELAEKYRTLCAEMCSREAVRVAVVSSLVAAGRGQGWLPAALYDEAAALIANVTRGNGPGARLLAGVQRVV